MDDIINTILTYLPRKQHITPKQWISFDCVLPGCNDRRSRGGVKVSDGIISYNCFNCGYTCSWQPGTLISKKMKHLMVSLNMDDTTIAKLSLSALRTSKTETTKISALKPVFHKTELPENSKLLSEWIETPTPDLIKVLSYLESRNLYLDDYPFYWSNLKMFKNRIILPFYYNNNIVGYTARSITKTSTLRYVADQQSGYLFNIDSQHDDREFIIVCEGPFDAISINGCAILGSTINPQQNLLLSELRKEIIYVPDRNKKGLTTIDQALEYKWAVSFPPWPDTIEDINEAVVKLGRLTTLWMILTHKETNPLTIKVKKNIWFNTE